jgi:hypothetical protein
MRVIPLLLFQCQWLSTAFASTSSSTPEQRYSMASPPGDPCADDFRCRSNLGVLRHAVAVLFMAACALFLQCDLVLGVQTFYPNIVVCGSITSACTRSLPVSVFQPLGGTDPYYVQNCVTPGFTCLPVQFPIGDWMTSWVCHYCCCISSWFSLSFPASVSY